MIDGLEADIVDLAVSGDSAARDAVVEALTRPLYNLALRVLLSPVDAEDASQEALIKIITKMPTFEGRSSFSTWAWTVATRTYLDYRRGKFRTPLLSFEDFEADLADGLDHHAEENPEDRVLLAQVKIGCARALLQCLDGEHRLTFILGEIMEMTGPEGAEVTGVTEATFRKRLSRARQDVYDALRSHCGVIEPSVKCRCHLRLRRAMELGRVDRDSPDLGIDVTRLRAFVHQLDDIVERGAAYFRADIDVEPGQGLRKRLLELNMAAPF